MKRRAYRFLVWLTMAATGATLFQTYPIILIFLPGVTPTVTSAPLRSICASRLTSMNTPSLIFCTGSLAVPETTCAGSSISKTKSGAAVGGLDVDEEEVVEFAEVERLAAFERPDGPVVGAARDQTHGAGADADKLVAIGGVLGEHDAHDQLQVVGIARRRWGAGATTAIPRRWHLCSGPRQRGTRRLCPAPSPAAFCPPG